MRNNFNHFFIIRCRFGFWGKSSGVDLSSLTNAVDFGSVLVGIMAVAASIITLYAGFAGVRWILRMVKGA
ncbi:hypothetical protein IC611_13335 [Proteus mirabilis]